MEWIKATPDTIPDGTLCLATLRFPDDEELSASLMVESDVFYNKKLGQWCLMYDKMVPAWMPISDRYRDKVEVTHWMPYPKPPED